MGMPVISRWRAYLCRNVWVLTRFPGAIAPSSSARFAAVFTQRHAVVGCASTILPWADVPVGQCAAQRAVQLRMHRHKPSLATLPRPCCHL